MFTQVLREEEREGETISQFILRLKLFSIKLLHNLLRRWINLYRILFDATTTILHKSARVRADNLIIVLP